MKASKIRTYRKQLKQQRENPSPDLVVCTKLYFMNLLNNAGPNDKPVTFSTYYNASRSCPALYTLCEKLTHTERNLLIKRIENLL